LKAGVANQDRECDACIYVHVRQDDCRFWTNEKNALAGIWNFYRLYLIDTLVFIDKMGLKAYR